MKYLSTLLRVGIIVTLSFVPLKVQAETVVVPPLVIREIKITGEELVVLQATADIPDLSEYWVGYTGSDTANPGAIVPSQQLPVRSLAAGQALLMTSDGGTTCDAVLVTKLSVALADTKGTLVVRRLQSSGLSSTFTTVDSVNWAKPGVTGTTTAALDLRKETASMTYALWYHDPSLANPWRVGNLAGCTLTLAPLSSTVPAETVEWVQAAVEPPAIIENINEVEATPEETAIPGDNAGLAPPLITEILPNPAGTGTDGTDEYIELYNANDASFYLSGFTLQTGLATKHSYLFPSGVTIAPKSFRTFYASQTSLSMSNTSGQAALLDGSGAVVAQSDPYDSAPDGQAWALANGTWYWTTKPTDAATNIIAQPIVKPATAAKRLTVKTASTSTAKVKSAATTKKTSPKTNKTTAQKTVTTPVRETASIPGPVPIHPAVLAVVAASAVGYGAYVYRKDLANAFAKLRRH
ncbi:MAG: lamin tail domain-containing protein [Candidatus Saccharimonadales bacterium]|nr:lamin tail domain-containing protein [Candidatus Saccharibacteria bacterium]